MEYNRNKIWWRYSSTRKHSETGIKHKIETRTLVGMEAGKKVGIVVCMGAEIAVGMKPGGVR